MSITVKSRIAPTPSGFLHLGNAFNFLLTTLLVDFFQGHLHLRIDDCDTSRLNLSAIEDIFFQLEWLGIEYDSGPSGPDELFSKFSQRLRKEFYFEAIEILQKNGNIFACECSRSEIREISINGNYPGTCRHKNLDFLKENLPWRVKVPFHTNIKFKNFENNYENINVAETIGDFIVKRRDGLPSYQITSLIDDMELGINLIVRGKDLLASTGAQIFLANCLNDSIFPRSLFVHHQLLKNESGKKLSKSAGHLSLKVLKNKLKKPSLLYQQTAKLLNIPYHGISTLDHLKEIFRTTMHKQNILRNCINF